MKIPLFWVICLIHFLESPLHHMIEYWDGERKNPTATSGPLGDAVINLPNNLKAYVRWDRKPFKNANIPVLDDAMLQNNDVKNCYKLVQMIVTGIINEELLNMILPTMHKARWITMALRYLRLYVQEEKPSLQLKKIVKFIICWWAVLFFNVKRYPLVQNAPKHFHQAIVLAKANMNKTEWKFAQTYFQWSCYWAHCEPILLAMLNDSNQEKRQWAVNKIIEIRRQKELDQSESDQVRVYQLPTLNFDANSYDEMIDWEVESITEPRPTFAISNNDLQLIGNGDKKLSDFIPPIVCHSQANEFAVADTTRVVKRRKSKLAQRISLLQGIKARKRIPYNFTKKHFDQSNDV